MSDGVDRSVASNTLTMSSMSASSDKPALVTTFSSINTKTHLLSLETLDHRHGKGQVKVNCQGQGQSLESH